MTRNEMLTAVATKRGFEDSLTITFARICDAEYETDETVAHAFNLAMRAPIFSED